ncbi:FAD-binding domain-containing protein [Penicillium expansum]|nr:FAD-binding domain-containing protein [Penicillium expansum]
MPWDNGYAASLKRWSVAAEIQSVSLTLLVEVMSKLIPFQAVVVRPTCAEEVSAAVKFAVANKLPLAVCDGGHSTSEMSSSEGMVVQLGNMRNVEIGQAMMTVSSGGGCLWADVDSALEACGLATVGGAVNHTGMVTSDGSILEASESQNPDLFWAVRGAGAQIGVVTRFTSRVYTQGQVWSGTLTFIPDKLPELVAFANEFHNRDQREGHCLAIAVGYAPDGATRILLHHSALPWARVGSESVFFEPSQHRIHHGLHKYDVHCAGQHSAEPNGEYGIRRLQGSSNVTMPLHSAVFQQMADKIWSFHDMHPDVKVCALAIELFSTHKLREVPQNAAAYANRGEYYDAITVFGWTNPALETMRTGTSCKRTRVRGSWGHGSKE